jgi:hypothetical protein
LKNHIHRKGLATAALLTLSLPSMASLPMPPPIAQELPAAACLDDESPEARQRRGSRLLVHEKLAYHLQRLRSDNHHPLAEYRCEGSGKTYHAHIADDAVTVESRYLREGTVHATVDFQKSRRHGVLRTLWPDGAVQSVEYYCRGQPVGFHRYHDAAGRLVAIADHAHSDYRWRRRLPGMTTTIEPATEAGKSDRVVQQPLSDIIRIRMLFGVQGTQVSAPALQQLAVGGYQSLNPEARLAQLVTAGDQGWITLEGRRMRIINAPMDYTPFWEVYERERKGLPGADPLPSETKELLACPWIDEAMAPPLPHRALARPAVAALTDAERQATPRARYEACLQQPTPTCLMPFALPLALNEQSSRELLLRATAVAALETRQPGVAKPAIEELFAKESGFNLPNPHFALPELLRAQAALRAGDKARAEVHAKAALVHAQRVAPTYSVQTTLNALKRVGPELARMGFADLASSASEQLKASDALSAAEILAAAGETHARAGRLEAAANALALLRQPEEVRQVPDSPRGKQEWSYYSPPTAQTHAFARIAQALAQKGDTEQARAMLAKAEAAFERTSGSFFDAGATRLALALAHAAAGNPTPAQGLAKPPGNEQWNDVRWDAIQRQALEGLCDAGRAAYWMDRRAYPHVQIPKPSESFAFARFGALAAAHMRCGQVQQARSLLEQAKSYRLPTPPGDVVNAAPRNEGIASAMLEAGQWDMLVEWAAGRSLGQGFQIRWAERQAEAGDRAAARTRLATLANAQGRMAEVTRIQLMLAQARVEAGTGRPDSALLSAAHAAASAIDRPQDRAQALLAVARAYAAAGEPTTKVRQALVAARAGFDTVLGGNSPRQAPVDFSFAGMQLGLVAQEFVAAGSLEEALATATQPYLRPGALAAGHQTQGLDARVEAAIWAHKAPGMGPRAAQSAFEALPPGTAKAQALDQVLRTTGTGRAAAATWKDMALRELAANGTYFEAAASSYERRALVGLFASWMRSLQPHQSQPLLSTTQLEQLARQARRIGNAGWQARSLCELGATGILLGLPAGAPLLQEGSKLAIGYDSKFYPLDPPPTGACAHWSRQAGEKEAAATLVDRTMWTLRGAVTRTPEGQHPTQPRDLLNTSLALFEAEQGELPLDWAQPYWRD